MALAVVHSRALDGLQAPSVTVEVHMANGLPGFTLVGLPDTEVKEARDRVRAAIINSGFEFPARRLTVNLAPADLPKESGRFDLPIALGILAASGQIPAKALHDYEFVGELSLSGHVRSIRGAFALAMMAATAGRLIVFPSANVAEAQLSGNPGIRSTTDLIQITRHLRGEIALDTPPSHEITAPLGDCPDFQEVKGQTQAKRALEIAAAGQHSLLMAGPPGSGKSMLAARLPGIMPMMSTQAAQASAAIRSLANQFRPEEYGQRAFRSPHHTASAIALVGGGNPPRPGEISLAHEGILFLDELPEFDRRVLETLREPLESGEIHIARAARQATFPARFQLIAAMNPCPCGYQGDQTPRCHCTPDQIRRYRNRLSGPLLDRIDLMIEVPALPPETLAACKTGETSALIRERVEMAHVQQQGRQKKPNAQLSAGEIETHCPLKPEATQLLTQASQRLNLSARSWHRIIKVGRTIADLAGQSEIHPTHIAEAIQYRRLTHV